MIAKNIFDWFRKIAFAEGVSFLLLLFIAMPLKYFAGLPLMVTIVGGMHGILFIAFIILALLVKSEFAKNFWWLLKAFIASIIPFGTFVMDREWRRDKS